jgi:hypothetical protein
VCCDSSAVAGGTWASSAVTGGVTQKDPLLVKPKSLTALTLGELRRRAREAGVITRSESVRAGGATRFVVLDRRGVEIARVRGERELRALLLGCLASAAEPRPAQSPQKGT